MRDPIDTIKPWTIKAVSVEARDLAIVAARRDGLTVGQWLERVIRDAVADGSAVVANKSALEHGGGAQQATVAAMAAARIMPPPRRRSRQPLVPVAGDTAPASPLAEA